MKKTLILLLAAMVTFSLVPSCNDEDELLPEEQVEPEPEEPDEPETPDEPEEPDEPETGDQSEDDGIIKILAIGNSFSEDAVEQNLWDLFDAAGIEAVIGELRIGSTSLEDHYNNMVNNSAAYSYRKIVNGVKTTKSSTTMLYGIVDEDWDYISFQQSSPLSGIYSTYTPYLPSLVDYARTNATNENMEVVFFQTWAYASDETRDSFKDYNSDQLTMYYAIVDAVNRAAEDNDIKIIIPAGTAIQNGRNSWMGDVFNRDGHHLDYDHGRYTAACAWFEKLSGVDVTTTTYAPDTVSEDVKDVCTHAAHFAVLEPDNVNPMTEWQEHDVSNLIPLTAPNVKIPYKSHSMAILEWEVTDAMLAEQAFTSSGTNKNSHDVYDFRLWDSNGDVVREVDGFFSFNFTKYPSYRIAWGGFEPNKSYKLQMRRVATNTLGDYTKSDWASVDFTTDAAPDTSGYLLWWDFDNVPFGACAIHAAYGFKRSTTEEDWTDPDSLTYESSTDDYNTIMSQSVNSTLGQPFFDTYFPGLAADEIMLPASTDPYTEGTTYNVAPVVGHVKFGASKRPAWLTLPALEIPEGSTILLEVDACPYYEPSTSGNWWSPTNDELSYSNADKHNWFYVQAPGAKIESVEGEMSSDAEINGDLVKLHNVTYDQMKSEDPYRFTTHKVKISGAGPDTRIVMYQSTERDGNQHRMWMDNVKVSLVN